MYVQPLSQQGQFSQFQQQIIMPQTYSSVISHPPQTMPQIYSSVPSQPQTMPGSNSQQNPQQKQTAAKKLLELRDPNSKEIVNLQQAPTDSINITAAGYFILY